jgi:hypothetical protein
MVNHEFPSGKDTLRERIDLQTPLSHLGILKELEGEPDQVTLDLAQLFAHILWRHELVKDVACLDAARRKVSVIVIECFD